MPELPEVETIARGLAAALIGATVCDVPHARADYVRPTPPGTLRLLAGSPITDVSRHGKRLTVQLGGARLLIHLGMSGRLLLTDATTPRPPHTHLVLRFTGRSEELRLCDPRRFGGVWVYANGAGGAHGTVANRRATVAQPPRARNGAHPGPLGPDALSIRWPVFRAVLSRARQMKALLLDQKAIAGLGNIYVDEALWAAQIHPLTQARTIPERDARRLHRALRRILKRAIEHGGSTLRDYRDAAGGEGAFQRLHRVYGREGKPCSRCGASIERQQIAGRSTHICPRCQRRPR